jgi:hypothetical protein
LLLVVTIAFVWTGLFLLQSEAGTYYSQLKVGMPYSQAESVIGGQYVEIWYSIEEPRVWTSWVFADSVLHVDMKNEKIFNIEVRKPDLFGEIRFFIWKRFGI